MKNILVNSTLAFVSAFVLTTLLHESGHYLSYWMFGAEPALFHNHVRVNAQLLSLHAKVISALAGPVSSLLQGIAFALIVSRRGKNTAWSLLFLWMSLLGFVNFFGYLAMTPLSATGDTGKVAELIGIGRHIRIAIAVFSLAILMWVIFNVAEHFAKFIPAQLDVPARSGYVYRLMFFPIMLGSLANTLLAFPAAAILSIIYPATSPYVIMSSFGRILKTPSPAATKFEIEEHLSKSLLILTVCMILLNRVLAFDVG